MKHFQTTPLPLFAASLALVASCGGGGGGAPIGSTGPRLNDGSYTVAEFGHVNTRPPGYHPLGRDGSQVLSRDELFVVWPGADGESREFRLQDDADTGNALVAGMAALFGPSEVVHAAAAGQLDDDADSELVVATIDPAETRLSLHVVERGLGGDYERTDIGWTDADSWNFEDARLDLGDVDGDGRDEIVVAMRSARYHSSAGFGRVQVFDDPQDGGLELMSYTRVGGHIGLWGLALDADGDGDDEVVVGLSGDATDSGRYAVRLYDLAPNATSMTQLHGWHYLYGADDQYSSRAVAGDFDGDGREDLAWVGYSRPVQSEITIRLFELAPGPTWSQYAQIQQIDFSGGPLFGPGRWDVTAVARSTRRSELAYVFPRGDDYHFRTMRFDRGLGQWQGAGTNITRFDASAGVALAGSDVDADGVEETILALVDRTSGAASLDIARIAYDGQSQLDVTWQPTTVLQAGATSPPPVPVLAAGDYDADGFALRSTGMRSQRLAAPIPLVVLSAPPTVAGISQNYDDTESSYSVGQSQGSKIGVTSSTTLTGSVGGGFDLFGLVGVSGRASIGRTVERTTETSTQTTTVEGYVGAYDSDVIVFQGTLYETYEYEIVGASDPAAIGSLVTLDLPVDSNVYKWTVEYYNSQVDPEDRIGPDVLTHTPGVISSYPTRAELDLLTFGEQHWDFGGSRPVGQGGASDFQVVSFAEEQASEVQRSIQRGYGGGLSFGISAEAEYETSEGSTFGVTYGTETVFEASVGDISEVADYEAWKYDWGFSVHTVGKRADGANVPTGYSDRKHSFQYLRYWVEPTGFAH